MLLMFRNANSSNSNYFRSLERVFTTIHSSESALWLYFISSLRLLFCVQRWKTSLPEFAGSL